MVGKYSFFSKEGSFGKSRDQGEVPQLDDSLPDFKGAQDEEGELGKHSVAIWQ